MDECLSSSYDAPGTKTARYHVKSSTRASFAYIHVPAISRDALCAFEMDSGGLVVSMEIGGSEETERKRKRRRVITLVGAPLACELVARNVVEEISGSQTEDKQDEISGLQTEESKQGEGVDRETEVDTFTTLADPLSTKRITYISDIPPLDHILIFGPQQFSFLAVILSVSTPIKTKSGAELRYIIIVDSSVSYKATVASAMRHDQRTETTEHRDAARPLVISAWDLARDLCYFKGEKWTRIPQVGDIVCLTEITIQAYRGTVRGTTRRQCSRVNVLLTAAEARCNSTVAKISALLLDARRTPAGASYRSSFMEVAGNVVSELRKWVLFIEHDRSMCPPPQRGPELECSA